jgi:hypothetical protein
MLTVRTALEHVGYALAKDALTSLYRRPQMTTLGM